MVQTPSCRKSTASRPGDVVYVCRITEYESRPWAERNGWWIYFRKVDGHWPAVNKRLATSSYAFGTERNLEARTAKIRDLAWVEDWNAVQQYAPAVVPEIKADILELKESGHIGPTGWDHCTRVKPAYRQTYGEFFCGWLVTGAGDILKGIVYRVDSARWLAVDTQIIPDEDI